jgi:hypothetical protein
MRATLLHRSERAHPREVELAGLGVPTIRSLHELARLL